MSHPLPSTLRVHGAITDIPRASWDALLTPEARPFLEWEWLAALEQSGSVAPENGWHPRHLTLWRGTRLLAAAPAYVKDDSQGEFVFDWAWASAAERLGFPYYPKLVLAVPHTPATGRRVLAGSGPEALAQERALYAGALDYARAEGLSGVHVLFPTAAETQTLAALGFHLRLGVQYHWQRQDAVHFEDYLARFTARRRHQLRRERKELAAQGVTLTTLQGEALSAVDPREVHALHADTVDRHPSGRRFLTEAFFRRVLETCRQGVEWVEARRGGTLLAGAFNVIGPSALYGRWWGARERLRFLHFNVCLYRGVEETLARSLERFEPGAGGEHKLVRGFEPALTHSAHLVFHPRLDRAVGQALVQERAAILGGLPRWRAETGLKG